jgi:hypothetical protein
MAVDHEQLMLLVTGLEASGDWTQVRLTRATREPFLRDAAIAFQVECQAP